MRIMPSSRRNRKRRPGRRTPFRKPRPLILIVCEGEITEPEYLKGFANAFRNPLVEIRIAPEHGFDPKTLVEIAKQYKKDAEKRARKENDDNLMFDGVWVVFDVDEHRKVPDALQMARDNVIEVALSNPAVELWLLLHFRDSPGMKDRKEVSALLKKFIGGYDKHVNYADYADGYSQAVTRAAKLDKMALKSGQLGCNPTTGVYKLTESIRIGGLS
jgi:RloB-like protein